MRIRTIWDWRLRLYPLIVIPAIVYVAAQDAAAPPPDRMPVSVESGPASAAPLSGYHHGRAITCYRHPDVTLCYRLTEERG